MSRDEVVQEAREGVPWNPGGPGGHWRGARRQPKKRVETAGGKDGRRVDSMEERVVDCKMLKTYGDEDQNMFFGLDGKEVTVDLGGSGVGVRALLERPGADCPVETLAWGRESGERSKPKAAVTPLCTFSVWRIWYLKFLCTIILVAFSSRVMVSRVPSVLRMPATPSHDLLSTPRIRRVSLCHLLLTSYSPTYLPVFPLKL